MVTPELSPHALTSLVAIADHGSLSAAARHRNLTQPSLSRQVQELESRLGTQLVERGAHGARLTPAGETLAEGAREVLSMLSGLPDRVRSREGEVSGRIRLGTVDSVGIYVLPPILAKFINNNPQVDVQVVCNSSPQLLSLLRADELDLVIGTIDDPKLGSELLYQNRLVLAYPPGTPHTKIPKSLEEISDHRIVTFPKHLTVRRLLDQACDQAGVEFEPVMELANVEAIKAIVRAGLGFGIIPEGCVQGFELETVYVKDLNIHRSVRMLYRNQSVSLAAQRLMDDLRDLRQL